MTLTEVRRLLTQLDIRPSKSLGQNFLIDANILQIIVREADIRRDETVLEIGPGLGMLTAELARYAQRVVAIEKDKRLCQYLRENFSNIELIEADAVESLPRLHIAEPFKVVANLPYSISSPVLERLVERQTKPRAMVLTLQREAAQRLAAAPRHKDYGALTLFTQLHYHVTIARIISPACFYPAPGVDSAVVVLNRRDPRVKLEPGAPFHELVRLGFAHRRKMLRRQIEKCGDAEAAFAKLGISTNARAEELSLDQWIALANALRL